MNGALDAASDAFWSTFAAAYPEVKTGDVGPGDLFHWNQEIRKAGRTWLESNQERTEWQERIDRYRQVAEFFNVGENTNPAPDDLHESFDYALVLSNEHSIGVYGFETFNALCDYVSDSFFDGDTPVAVFDLRDGRSIALHIAALVSISEDQALAHRAPWDKD